MTKPGKPSKNSKRKWDTREPDGYSRDSMDHLALGIDISGKFKGVEVKSKNPRTDEEITKGVEIYDKRRPPQKRGHR